MKLHLGCGGRNFGDDWIHIDQSDEDSCDVIYASHLLEYFDREEALQVLMEWRRCLKVGGVLRVAVPDFAAMCTLYKTGHSLEMFLGPLYGKMGDPPFYHKTVYDYCSLKLFLESLGFLKVKKYAWELTDHASIDDQSQAYIPHMDKDHGTLVSLNVEAVK